MSEHEGPPASPGSAESWHDPEQEPFVPPARHLAADRAGKQLLNLAGSINRAIGAEDDPIVVNRAGRHVSFKSLEDLIDKALEG